MKVRDVLRIGIRNIQAHPKRNLMVIIVMGITFGLVLAMNIWFRGLKAAYTELAGLATDGKVIIVATNDIEGAATSEEQKMAAQQAIITDIEMYGGTILSDAQEFGAFGSVILPKETVESAIEIDLSKVPADAAPTLVTTFLGEQLLNKNFAAEYTNANSKQTDYESYRNALIGHTFTDEWGTKYYIVGLAPGNFHVSNLSFQQLERNNKHPLNPVLEQIAMPAGKPIIIGNSNTENWQTEATERNDTKKPVINEEKVIAIFPSSSEAYNYFWNGKGKFMNIDLPDRTYTVSVVAGMSPETQYVLKIMQIVINAISVVLGTIAITVVIFTSIRLVDQERQNIKLYHHLGATSRQVRAVYLLYFLELMVGAVVLAFSLASIATLLFSFLNQDLIETQAMLGFSLNNRPYIIWYGVDWITALTIIIMLAMAPICIAINHKSFTA